MNPRPSPESQPVSALSRRATVDRLWRRAQLAVFNRSWRRASLGEAIWLPSTMLALLVTVMGVRWWDVRLGGPFEDFSASIAPERLAWALLAVGGANQVVAFWALRQGLPRRRPGWLPLLLAGLPGFGALWATAVGRWQADQSEQDDWTANSSLDSRFRCFSYRLERGPRGAAGLLPWLTLSSFVGLLLLLVFLASRPSRAPAPWHALAVAALHLLGFALARLAAREPYQSLPQRWRLRLDLLWLLPLAGPALAWTGSQFLAGSGARSRSLVSAAFLHRSSLKGSPRWRLSERQFLDLHHPSGWYRRWQRLRRQRRTPEPSERDERFRQVARGKIDSLLLDGLALGWLVGFALRVIGLDAEESLSSLLRLTARVLLVAGLLAIVATGVRLASPSLDARASPWPGPHPLVWSAFTVLNSGLGLLAGALLGLGSFNAFAQLVALGAALGLMASALPLMLAEVAPRTFDTSGGDSWHWAVHYCFVMLAALPLLAVAALLAVIAPALPWLPAAAMTNVWLGQRRAGQLLEPFEPHDLERSELPLRIRLALGFLRATLYLPLGGLFVTLWPTLRRWLETSAGTERRLERAHAGLKEA